MTAPARKAIGAHENAASGTDTWLTPRHVLDAIGPFDLDPCAAPDPEKWPTARRHYTYRDDGLRAGWGDGRVFLNPPYSQAWRWVQRLTDHPGGGTALLFARTETAAFRQWVWERADALLFLHGRLIFHTADGAAAPGNAGAPSVLVAYGRHDAHMLATCGLPGVFIPGWIRTGVPEPQPDLFDQ